MADIITFHKENFQWEYFKNIVEEYLAGISSPPVLVADSYQRFEYPKSRVKISFFDGLLTKIITQKAQYKRDLNSILTYGFIGNSRGVRNGIVEISMDPSRGDRNFGDVLNRFLSDRYKQFCDRIKFRRDRESLIPIKVVSHRKNGQRLVGVLNKKTWEGLLYDIRSYRR